MCIKYIRLKDMEIRTWNEEHKNKIVRIYNNVNDKIKLLLND